MFPQPEIDDYQFPLPGFRFHPTDDELVGFYLRRKVDKKAIGTELIKSIDIYKHNPWDLPNAGNNLGEKEWYFFCKRGRKYKNSIRPNRVTGSGFWKATGIDKAIYSQLGNNNNNNIIGLKKTLVYYKGNAGRGTKTEWMMHEFRLPPPSNSQHHHHIIMTSTHLHLHYSHHSSIFGRITNNNNSQEAEIWTLCRIFKRSVSSRKYAQNWREIAAAAANNSTNHQCYDDDHEEDMKSADESINYINFSSSFVNFDDDDENKKKKKKMKPAVINSLPLMMNFNSIVSEQIPPCNSSTIIIESPSSSSCYSNFDGDATDLFGYKDKKKLQLLQDHFSNIHHHSSF